HIRKNGSPVQRSTEQAQKPKPGHGIRTAIRENWPVLSDGIIIQARPNEVTPGMGSELTPGSA
ncbi:MAG: hypothetical protein ACRCZ6_06430, partial [Kluyvera sp.]|uniref:hypothetical protein n=1 Tax=Kluyvera sp. TaxID=1538228 RepID=UPI003F40EF0E